MKKEGQVRIPSGCAISAVISRKGEQMSGEGIMKSMVPMHERSNGLGGGFAVGRIQQTAGAQGQDPADAGGKPLSSGGFA